MKSILDSSLVTAGTAALLYFSGLIYYMNFFMLVGIPSTEFLPPVQIVVGRGFSILFESAQEHLAYILAAVVVAIATRLLRRRSARLWRWAERWEGWLRPLVGWPLLLLATVLYGAFVYHCVNLGVRDADNYRTSVATVRIY